MNIAEILRGIADKIDGVEQQGSDSQNAELHKVDVSNDENPDVNTQPMISPLQMQAELLKQVTGQEDTCEQCGQSPCECEQEDELNVMQRNAGLPVVAVRTMEQ